MENNGSRRGSPAAHRSPYTDRSGFTPKAVPVGSATADRLRSIAGFVAPTTVLAALAYYYGYVTTRAKYSYFGIDLATLRLSNQDLALQSVAAVYAPVCALLVVAIAAYLGHLALRRWLRHGSRASRLLAVRVVGFAVGVPLLVRAIVGIVVPVVAETEAIAVTPACLGLGALVATYGALAPAVHGGPRNGEVLQPSAVRPVWYLVSGIVVLALFWIANSFAAAYGLGQGQLLASRLDTLPSVTVDTRERLYVPDPAVLETALPDAPGQQFHYRYRNLRLVVESGNRLFLVAGTWRRGQSSLMVVDDDDTVRLRLEP